MVDDTKDDIKALGLLKKVTARRWLRIALPVFFILVWLALASFGGPTFGKLSGVISNNQASFLPASAESTEVLNIQKRFYSSDTVPAVAVIVSKAELTSQQLGKLASLKGALQSAEGVSGQAGAVAGPIPSKDKRAAQYIVQLNTQNVDAEVTGLRSLLSKHIPPDLQSYVTGPAGLTADLIAAFGGIDGILLLVAVAAVFIILILVYRSVILPFVVLLTAIFALAGAILVVYALALHDVIKLNGQSQGILFILVIGAATDYSLLIVSRYREALQEVKSKWQAMAQALGGALEPVAASAATVILALLCLLFSDLNSNRSLGPVAALGIAFAFLAALSFLPSLLIVFGRGVFWPRTPKYQPGNAEPEAGQGGRGLWPRVAGFVGRRSRWLWPICMLVLLACASGLLQLRAGGVPQTATVLGKSDAAKGQKVLAQHFPAGSGSPLVIVAPRAEVTPALNVIKGMSGLKDASVYTGQGPSPKAKPIVKGGEVLLSATLTSAPSSNAAQRTVRELRHKLAAVNPAILVGGQPAITLDTNQTAKDDLYKIVPIVLAVILLILMLLLRSLVSAAVLIGSVVLSYAATLGVSALVFNHIFKFPGADPAVPLFGFIFLVALGVDYNIFLMTRVREEALRVHTRTAILRGLKVTGGVITSAGVVLAATFAALGVIPILFLVQIAFIVAFGVLLDTIVVRSLLIPAVTYDIGRNIWWPSRLSRENNSKIEGQRRL